MNWAQYITAFALLQKIICSANINGNSFFEPRELVESTEFQKQELLNRLLEKVNAHCDRPNTFTTIPWDKITCKGWPEAVKSKSTTDWTTRDLEILEKHIDEIRIHFKKECIFELDLQRILKGTYSNLQFDQFRQKYELQSYIGNGGFGFVIKCRRVNDSACFGSSLHFNQGPDCVVKCSYKSQINRKCSYKHPIHGRVSNEVHHLKRISHPKIIKFVDYADDGVYEFLVTELFGTCWDLKNPELNAMRNPGLKTFESTKYIQVNRNDLKACILAHESFPDVTIHRLFIQIYEAVLFLHERRICHCDLKCENVLVDADYQIKLIDFGLAKRIKRDYSGVEKLLKSSAGTRMYMAPERLAMQPFKVTVAEVWSLGILLYNLKTFNFPPLEFTAPLPADNNGNFKWIKLF